MSERKPAIIFDLFGTLVAEYDQERFDRLLRNVFLNASADPAITALDDRIAYETFKVALQGRYKGSYAEAAKTHQESPSAEEALVGVLTEIGGTAPSAEALARLIDHYAAAESLEPLEETDRVLTTLVDRGYDMALLSNVFFPGWIYEQHLEHLGLTRHLQYRFYSSDHPYMKPHRYVFEEVARSLGRPASECVMVGDRVDLDIVGARNAGWRTVLIAREPEPDHGATWVIDRLEAILPLFP